eukprot:g8487.t1
MDLLTAHKKRQRDQSTWATIKTDKLGSALSQRRRISVDGGDDSKRCLCCDLDLALKTMEILRSKMVTKNNRIEAEVQRRLDLDQQLRYATS